jgi:hypothetical protein
MDSNDKAIPLMAGKAQRKAVVHVAARPRIQSRSQGPDGLGPTSFAKASQVSDSQSAELYAKAEGFAR